MGNTCNTPFGNVTMLFSIHVLLILIHFKDLHRKKNQLIAILQDRSTIHQFYFILFDDLVLEDGGEALELRRDHSLVN